MAIGSFSAGLAGLNANSTYLSVIGNNLANINTVGYKGSSVQFSDLVSQTLAGSSANPMQIGLGVVTGSISPTFSQGAIEGTREATNAAIQGNGFFVVSGPGGTAYTRAGNFTLDDKGVLVTPDGWRVQGYTQTDPVTGEIIATATANDIIVPPGVLREPTATTQIKTVTNLNAAAEVGDTFSTPVQIHDSLGNTHVLTINYEKTGTNAWTFEMTVPGADITPGATVPAVLASGTIGFDAFGQVATITPAAPATGGINTGTVPPTLTDISVTTPAWANGAAASTISWDLVGENNAIALSGYGSPSATTSKTQNGSAAGMVDKVSIAEDGSIVATLGAGKTITIGQIAIANFNNPKGLVKIGGNRYGESDTAGIANVGVAGTGGRGTLVGSALEQSNVDIAQEFTQMILAQRGYQANSKTITVSDELMLETLNLKR